MNKQIAAILARAIRERVARNRISTIAGLLGLVALFGTQFSAIIPDKYKAMAITIGSMASSVAALLSFDTQALPDKEGDTVDRGSL